MHPGSPASFESGQTLPAESRRRLLEAMVRVAGSKGYRETTVADVVAEAESSEAAFHSHFAGRHDCFLAAYEEAIELQLAAVLATCDAGAPWTTRVRVGLETLVDRFDADPALARTAMVEAAVAGADALHLYFDAIGRFAAFLDAGREEDPGRALPDHIALMTVGGVAGLIADELAAARAGRLRDLLPDLVFSLLLPFVGAEAAGAEMQRVMPAH